MCRFYNTPKGCGFGDQCDFAHILTGSNNPSIDIPPSDSNQSQPVGQAHAGPGGGRNRFGPGMNRR